MRLLVVKLTQENIDGIVKENEAQSIVSFISEDLARPHYSIMQF